MKNKEYNRFIHEVRKSTKSTGLNTIVILDSSRCGNITGFACAWHIIKTRRNQKLPEFL